LVIVGDAGWRVEALVERLRRHAENGGRLFWLGRISDDALLKLYQLADGVLMASEGEGFGLPLVEAARYGKPVLARDIPVYREVAGENACFFGGRDPESLARALGGWLDAIAQGSAPLSSGIRTSTWAESTRRLCEALVPHASSG
jgi:glycosyltransferase involved in cell wall biosynthesis